MPEERAAHELGRDPSALTHVPHARVVSALAVVAEHPRLALGLVGPLLRVEGIVEAVDDDQVGLSPEELDEKVSAVHDLHRVVFDVVPRAYLAARDFPAID